MNKYFLWTVAIAALCSSCETDNETFATQTPNNDRDNQTTALPQAKNVEVNDYQMYQSILNSFVYDNQQPYQKNLLRFEQYVNLQMVDYGQETYEYQIINSKQVEVLTQADTGFIELLAYAKETKQAIYEILNNRFNSENILEIPDENERRLTETLFALHNDNKGNGYDDDILNDRRTIAFAYGAQYGFTQAVLYAGAIELMNR